MNTGRSRMVVFTQGPDSVIVVKDGKVQEFPAIRLSQEQIVDTNGAGDAFVGGNLLLIYLCKVSNGSQA